MGKKIVLAAFCVFLAMLVALTGCAAGTNSASASLTDYAWTLEFASDSAGKLVASKEAFSSDDGEISQCNVSLRFNEGNTFVLSNQETNETWAGSYEAQTIKDTQKLSLQFENTDTEMSGVCGTTVRADKTQDLTITLQTDEYILHFVTE
jgi:hypothetical protein